ncbi:hypothetical protein, partial [Raoultella sp. T31]|uniref:hypothetical protein n=1 Tax=Raoultella sp. T31 TaxID=2054594 RepID=UPI00197DE53D
RHSGDLIEFVEKSVDHIALCLSRFILLFLGIPQRESGLFLRPHLRQWILTPVQYLPRDGLSARVNRVYSVFHGYF